MRIPISIRTSSKMADIKGLVDLGATDCFMSPATIRRMGLGRQPLDKPRKIWNIDNTENKDGLITHYVDLNVQTRGIHGNMKFLITNIGHEDVVLGYPWLATYEPQFNWKYATIDETTLPVVLRSINPQTTRESAVRQTEKQEILATLQTQCSVKTTATDLAIQAQQYTTKKEIPEEYKDFAKVFSEEESKRYPPKRAWDHAIEFKKDAPDAIDCKVYPQTQEEDKALQKFLAEEVEKGYVRPSKSPYASPFFYIKKKDGKLRPVQDYWKINAITIRNQYPLPLISDLIRDLSNAHIYTKLDIRWGYNNIRIKEGDEGKAAFKTRYGLFEPTVMYFGLTNSPATFQTMMNYIFRDTILKHKLRGTTIRVYMDDIGIATCTDMTGHIAAVRDVLQVTLDHDLYFKPEKCTFHAPSMDYLGVILEKGVTRMDPVKIAGIDMWPTPKNVTEVRRAVGFFNFYRPFIKNFAHIARPLHRLTRKNQEWKWEQDEQQAFDKLKKLVTEEPVLAHPDLTQQFEVEVDASGYAVGATLMQRKEDGKKHPIGYFSATLNEAQRNYDIYDLELLAIVLAFRNWRPLLAGSPHKVIVYSDHLNLQYWRSPQKISRRVAREVLKLSEYDFEIRHIAGKANGRADALSRRPDYDQGEDDNRDVVVLPNKLFIRANTVETAPRLIQLLTKEDTCPEDPIYQQDENVLKPWVDAHRLKRIEGTWYKEGRRVVTGGLHDKRTIIEAHHKSPVYGHPGIKRTAQLVARQHWWPQITKDVMDYVKGCAECQRHKVNTRPTRAPLQPIFPTPEAMPFATIALDFITKLPLSQGYDSILTITDHDCSKAVILIPCHKEITAEEVAGLLIKHLFVRFGLPTKMISDRDPRFASKLMREICNIVGVKQNISTAYHPRTDGQSERSNQWVEQYLRFYVNERQDNWCAYLPMAEFAHNSWPHKITRKSPFELLMGYNPRADWIDRPSPIPQVALRLQQFREARAQAQELMIRAQNLWIKHKHTPRYQIGDLVWLEGRHLQTNQPMAKLAPRRHGPFKVTQVMSPINYKLELPAQWSIHPVFHTDLLTPYRETPTHGPNYERPPPELIEGLEEYEVERILDLRHVGQRRQLQYLVKWKGYPDSDNQWVNQEDVFAEEAIREFEKSTNSAVHPRKRSRQKPRNDIPHSSTKSSFTPNSSPLHMSNYYNGSPTRIFTAELEEGLITSEQARAICAARAAAGPITEDERVTLVGRFPDPTEDAVPPRALSPAMYNLQDPDTRVLYTERPISGAEVNRLLDTLPSRQDASPTLPVPPRLQVANDAEDTQDVEIMEERAVYASSGRMTGETASEGTTQAGDLGLADEDDEHRDYYPAEHTHISYGQIANDTPHAQTTEGNNMYRATVQVGRTHGDPVNWRLNVPPGFHLNMGPRYIPCPIRIRGVTRQAKYIQVIMGPNPMVLGVVDESDLVYPRPLYTTPFLTFARRPIYPQEDLDVLTAEHTDHATVDRCTRDLGDELVIAEIHRFRVLTQEGDRIEAQIIELERAFGEVQALKLGSIQRMEMADVMARLEE